MASETKLARCVLADIETKAQWNRWPSEAKARAFLEATARDRIRAFNTLMSAEEKASIVRLTRVSSPATSARRHALCLHTA